MIAQSDRRYQWLIPIFVLRASWLIECIGKTDLRAFIGWAEHEFKLPCLRDFLDAVPTAELTPLESMQTDEEEMGMTYAELSVFGKLRKVCRQGPYLMFQTLLHLWNHLSPKEIAVKGKSPLPP